MTSVLIAKMGRVAEKKLQKCTKNAENVKYIASEEFKFI